MEDSGLLFRVAFAVVLASLLCQGTTVALAARIARVLRPLYNEPLSRERLRGTQAPAMELMQFQVAANAPVESLRADRLELPLRSQLMTVVRDGSLVPLDRAILRAGDTVSVLAPGGVVPVLSRLFLTPGPPPAWDQVTYDFLLNGQARLLEVAALYGARALTEAERLRTLEQAMLAVFQSPPVEGDAVEIAGLRLTVTRMDGARIVQVGLLLPRSVVAEADDGKGHGWHRHNRARQEGGSGGSG
jgi:cell volume regulation protein A